MKPLKKAKGHEWCCVITSDVIIDAQFEATLPERMKQIMRIPTVGGVSAILSPIRQISQVWI